MMRNMAQHLQQQNWLTPLNPAPHPAGDACRLGARVVIANMDGFETYFAAAVRENKVPVTLTLDKASAQDSVVSTNTEWRGFVRLR